MQQMAEIPRALGFTDHQIQDALAQSVVIPGEGPDDGQQVINPFSSMGISDQDYVEMLQGIAMEKEGKRGLEVVRAEGTARFQEGASLLPLSLALPPLRVTDAPRPSQSSERSRRRCRGGEEAERASEESRRVLGLESLRVGRCSIPVG